ncbi:hypothetical protein ACHAWF_000495 [Thalassiosira exigua]
MDACEILEKCIEICEGAFQRNHANLIPNLMRYGAALRSTSNLAEPRAVYECAMAIHWINFKEGQNADVLEKLDPQEPHVLRVRGRLV